MKNYVKNFDSYSNINETNNKVMSNGETYKGYGMSQLLHPNNFGKYVTTDKEILNKYQKIIIFDGGESEWKGPISVVDNGVQFLDDNDGEYFSLSREDFQEMIKNKDIILYKK